MSKEEQFISKFMGRVKELLMEMQEHGYEFLTSGEKFVCSNHFKDKYLNQYIENHGEAGVCSYCGHKDTVIDMSDLANHIAMTISIYFNDIDSECLPLASSYYDDQEEDIPGIKRVGCYAVPENADVYEDTFEIMEDLGLHTDSDSLNDDIDHLFEDNTWIKKNPFELWWNQKKELQWQRFSDMVKHSRRFTFLAMSRVAGNDDILNDLGDILRNMDGILHSIPVGATLYRARSLDKELYDNFGFSDITSAPDIYAGQCRMNPAGVSMFYGAFDKETAITESIKTANEKVLVIGEFKTMRELTVVDLIALPTEVSIWMDKSEAVSFLKSFHKNITRPLKNNANEVIDYIPSQIFTEYLRWMFTDKEGRNIDGLLYRSSKTQKTNVVLFCNNENSHKWLKLENLLQESKDT